MLQDANVERYVEIAVNPLKKEIEQMKAQIEALNQALRIHDVVGRSEQLPTDIEIGKMVSDLAKIADDEM